MVKYRFKPTEIDAIQFDGSNWVETISFCGTRTVDGQTMPIFNPPSTYLFFAPTGAMAELYVREHQKHAWVKVGDWIIKRGDGDFILVDASLFKKLFELAGE